VADYLTSRELMRASGLKEHQIRQYVMIGLLKPATRTESGRMLFPRRAARIARLIKALNDSGYSLRDIREVFFEHRHRRRRS